MQDTLVVANSNTNNTNKTALTENKPIFVEEPQDTFVTKQPAVIRCVVSNTHIAYIECNNKINDFNNQNVDGSENLKTLIANVSKKDLFDARQANKTKPFTCACIAFTDKNEKLYSRSAIIRNAFIEKEFQFEPLDDVAYIGDNVELRCDAPRGEPTPTITWLKNDQNIDSLTDSARYKISNDNSLLIFVVNKDDTANYVCIASNIVDKRKSKPAKLTILDSSKQYEWSEWSDWSVCTTKCGEGTMSRTRLCKSLKTNENVSINLCGTEDAAIEADTCIMTDCQSEAQWSDWQDWSECTNECNQHRKRNCIQNDIIIEDKYCTSVASVNSAETRPCNTTQLCATENVNLKANVAVMSEPTSNSTSIPKQLNTVQRPSMIGFDKNIFSFLIGIAAGVIVLAFLVIILALIIKRRKKRKPEHNIYYTCERPQQKPEDPCLKLCCFKLTRTDTKIFSKKKKRIYNEKTGSSESKNFNEHQILIQNVAQQKQYQNSVDFENQLIYNVISNIQRENYEKACMYTPNALDFGRQTRLSAGKNRLNNSKESPTNCTVTTTLNSTPLSSASSTSSYYATPNQSSSIHKSDGPFRIVKLNSFRLNQFNLANQQGVNSYQLQDANRSPSIRTSNTNIASNFDKSGYLLKTRSIHAPSVVYETTSSVHFNRISEFINPYDICIEKVTAAGARLSLESGFTLLIPENALAPDQVELMYIAVCREDMARPKLKNEKSSLLSPVVIIGPPKVILLKPVVVIIEHCSHSLNTDWNVTLHVADNTDETVSHWRDELSDLNQSSTSVFLNATEKHFLLVTDKLARFSLAGDVKQQPHHATITSKSKRLVAFCGSSLTNNVFNLRVYCVDDLYVALQEILKDEEEIGGRIVETSDAFLITYSNQNNSINVCINELSDGWNCKYKVNHQEIPLNHVWNGKNHLLHCSFIIERIDSLNEEFNCNITAYQTNETNSVLKMNVNCSISDGFFTSNTSNESTTVRSGLCNWVKNLKQMSLSKQQKNSYYAQIEYGLKENISKMLDQHYDNEKNWKSFANKLGIKRNLEYFASRQSPTEILLLYFEAINVLKQLTKHKDDHINANSLQRSQNSTPVKGLYDSYRQKVSLSQQLSRNLYTYLSNEGFNHLNLKLDTNLNNIMENVSV